MKKFTRLTILLLLSMLGSSSFKALGQGNAISAECSYTDGSCISIGYVAFEFVEGNPDIYRIFIEYNIRQGGDSNCPSIRRITFNPSHQNSGVITVGSETEVSSSTIVEVVASSFKDRSLKMTIDYVNGRNTVVDLRAPESLECGAITPLPVELTNFEGKAAESGISLEWETASELNNSHFEVERSADGKSFSSMAHVRGRGTTSTTSNYRFTDKAPEKGINYYRLKQVDFDNTSSYSKTISVKWNAGDAMQVALLPNPCRNGDCNIALSNMVNREALVQLKDMAGRVVFSKKIRSDSHLLELPMHDLKQLKGLYFLTATAGDQVVHQRIVLE